MTGFKTEAQTFSLLELILIIISVVVIVGVILPSFSKVRETTRQSRCTSSLKQMGLGSLMYSGDYDGYFPRNHANGSNNWEPLVSAGYMEDGPMWNCPMRLEAKTTGADSAYCYIGSGLKDDSPTAASQSIGYDLLGNHPANGWMNILFADGSVIGGKPGTAIVSKGWTIDINNR